MRNLSWLILITLVVTVYLTSVASAGLNDGLLIYFPFDESSGKTAADQSGNNNDADLIDGAKWQPKGGKIGGAVALDGVGAAVEDEKGADYINGLKAFTISVWVKSDSVGHDRGIMFGKTLLAAMMFSGYATTPQVGQRKVVRTLSRAQLRQRAGVKRMRVKAMCKRLTGNTSFLLGKVVKN